MSILKYQENNVKYHIDIINTLTDKIKKSNLNSKDKKQQSVLFLLMSTISKHILRLSEAQIMSEVVHDKKLEYPPEIQEQVDLIRIDDIVLVGENSLEFSDGTSIDDVINKIKQG